MVLKQNPTVSEIKAKFQQVAEENNWRISILGEGDDLKIGLEMEEFCFSWWNVYDLGIGRTSISYDHTYSQKTGSTCKSYKRSWAKEERLLSKGFCDIAF